MPSRVHKNVTGLKKQERRHTKRMGYTHYWEGKDITEHPHCQDVLEMMKKVFEEEIKLYDGEVETELGGEEEALVEDWFKIGKGTIYFEGECESFCYNGGEWGFCKTQRYGYDMHVVAVLCILHSVFGVDVDSDGFKEDWEVGFKLAKKHFPGVHNPMDLVEIKGGEGEEDKVVCRHCHENSGELLDLGFKDRQTSMDDYFTKK